HQIGMSIIGQCVHYRSSRKIMPLIIAEEEIETHYGIEQLTEHISQVSLAALGLGPSLVRLQESESELGEPSAGAEPQRAIPVDQAAKGMR
ncbi:CerR family C-terminal domain-containing protein, partial [Planctomycetota bacterium]